VLVEADYRMKLIAMGRENPGVKGLRSQLSLLTPQGNSIQRWWFVPLYEPIEVDDAGLAYRLSGQRLQLLAQDEWSDRQGRRSDAAFTRASTEKFAQSFTAHLPELAEQSPVFAELQNVFDLAIVAALLRRDDWPRRLAWSMPTFLDVAGYPVERLPVPKSVESLASTTNRNRFVLGMVGGVTLVPDDVIADRNQAAAKELQEARRGSLLSPSDKSPPWWDRSPVAEPKTSPH
jgi:hypothetical protein